MPKATKIIVNDKPIAIVQGADKSNYICLTDMVRAQEKDVDRVNMVIQNWLRRKDTIEYLGLWERLNNPSFNDIEFDVIKTNAGTNRFVLTAKEWSERTGAIGIQAKAIAGQITPLISCLAPCLCLYKERVATFVPFRNNFA